MALASGHTYEEMDPKEKEQLRKDFSGPLNEDFIVLQPGGWLVPRLWLEFQERIYNFKFRPDDIVIMTYSKCGTTWMQEIVWNMLYNPNSGNKEADKVIYSRSPYIEADMIFGPLHTMADMPEVTLFVKEIVDKFREVCPGKKMEEGLNIQLAENFRTRRAIKTHLPFSLLPPNLLSSCKVIFVARNPKDMCLSSLHHHKLLEAHNFTGSQDEFVDYFVKDRLIYGSFAEMVKEAWSKKDHPNMHFLFFEDLKADTKGELKKINDFIGVGLSEQQLNNVERNTSFSTMKAKEILSESEGGINIEVAKKEGGFIHKGKAGGWRDKLTEAQSAKIDDYVKRHFDGTGLQFKF